MSVTVVQQIEKLLKFLEPLLGFANCHMVDFLTSSSYQSFVPPEIQREVAEVGLKCALDLIFNNDFSQTPNLGNFVQTSTDLTLKNCLGVCLPIDAFLDNLQSWGCDPVDKLRLQIFMSSKKSHEVEILSAVAASVAKLSGTSHIVDIGDGKGYLSSMLALHNKIPVVGVDASNVNTCGAVKRVTKLSKIWDNIHKAPQKSHPKKTENFESSNVDLYRQVTAFVDESFNLENLVSECFNVDLPLRLGLVGLHTCGDLSPSSLKIFVKNDSVKSVCNVGCCFHLITERASDDQTDNFPLSRYLTEKKFTIGRSARMIANQSVDRVMAAKELPNITIFYRAILQVMFQKFCTEMPTKHVGKFRKPPEDFVGYVRTALKRVEVSIDITDSQIRELYQCYESRIDELNVFYLLRCKLSPVIETLILLDRLLFLKERGFEKSFLVQLFDPVVSPRCYGVVALK